MELTHLRYFQAIAQHGSLTAAARALKVSQPTLTVAVRNLEEQLHTTLFLRERHGVTLTTTGHTLLQYASQILALAREAGEAIQGLETDEAGRFVLGCHEGLGAYFLPDFMSSFLEAAPRIELTLWNGTSSAVQQAVLDRVVHFGLVVNAVPHPDLVLLELFHDALDILMAVPADHVDAARGAPVYSDLAAARARIQAGPLIYAGRVAQCQELIGQLAELELLPSRMLSCGDLELVKSLALGGIGVALLPRRVAAYGHEGRMRRLHADLPYIRDTITLCFRGDLHRTHAALRLKEALVAYGRKLDVTGGWKTPG